MKVRGPWVTLGAVVMLGGGMWLVNESHERAVSAPSPPAVVVPARQAAAPANQVAPATPPPAGFPRHADYVAEIPVGQGVIALDITVAGDRAVAYACDGNGIEAWLTGSARDGVVSLQNKSGTSRLQGRRAGNSVTGTLWVEQRAWTFTAASAQPSAGPYRYQSPVTVDADGHVI